MSQFLMTIAGGLIVAFLASKLGFGGSTKVTVHGGQPVKKTGKWIMVVSVALFFVGVSMLEKGDPTKWGYDMNIPGNTNAISIVICSVFFFAVGKFVAWIQRP